MTQAKILTILAIVLVLIGGIFFWYRGGEKDDPVALNVPQGTWIEVINSPVFSLGNSKVIEKRELHSGDLIPVGTIVETDKNASANIHLPDGSLLRMDKDTTITLSESIFDKSSGKVTVSVKLTLGRVWSKVVGLTTPDSVWEVTTSNAVATVRGTAFSVSFKNGKSQILGSQHKIAVAPIDPKTKQKVVSSEILIEEHKLIEINDLDLKKQIPAAKVFEQKIVDAPKEIVEDEFVREAEDEDKQIDEFVKEVEKVEIKPEKVREKVLEKKIEKYDAIYRERKLEEERDFEKGDQIKGSKNDHVTSDVASTSQSTTTINAISTPVNIKPTLKLSVGSDRSYRSLFEGDKVFFSATLIDGYNTKKDVSKNVAWKLVGSIGKIDASGLFVAELDDSIAENGEGYGAVVATYIEDGQIRAIGKTEIIQVKIKAEATPEDIGGQ